MIIFIFNVENNKYYFDKIINNLVFLIKMIIIEIFVVIIIFKFFVLLKTLFRNCLFKIEIFDNNDFVVFNNLINCALLTRMLLITIKKIVDIV